MGSCCNRDAMNKLTKLQSSADYDGIILRHLEIIRQSHGSAYDAREGRAIPTSA